MVVYGARRRMDAKRERGQGGRVAASQRGTGEGAALGWPQDNLLHDEHSKKDAMAQYGRPRCARLQSEGPDTRECKGDG